MKRAAFSLVELSIVLVILGLLVGGILAGQTLIRAAELRSVTTEYQRYMTAAGAFRDKYFALPGDMSNATTFGSTWAGDGNADGMLENTNSNATNEVSLFWIHLTQSGMVEGSYTAVGIGSPFVRGVNSPAAKISKGGWNVIFLGTVAANGDINPLVNTTPPSGAAFFAGDYGNAFTLGNTLTGQNALLPAGLLKPEEAWNIDTKMDDGKPDAGKLMTLEVQGSATPGTACSNQDGANTAIPASAYDLTTQASDTCSFVFKMGY